jgi:hypothetical protein
MIVKYHADTANDLLRIQDEILKIHIKNTLKSAFYNIGTQILQYPNLYEYVGEGFVVTYVSNTTSILVISIAIK